MPFVKARRIENYSTTLTKNVMFCIFYDRFKFPIRIVKFICVQVNILYKVQLQIGIISHM